MEYVGKEPSSPPKLMGDIPTRLRSLKCIQGSQGRDDPVGEFVFFSLGPVYRFGGVDFCIPDKFGSETGKNFGIASLQFSRPIFSGLGPWNYILEAGYAEHFDEFGYYITGTNLVDSDLGKFWKVAATNVVIQDPIRLRQGGVIEKNPLVGITVYYVTGNHAHIEIEDASLGPARVVEKPPRSEMVEEAKAVLSAQKEAS